jgi:hypothetical protein
MTSAVTTATPAPPAPAAPPPLSPGGRTAVRAVLVVAASILVVGCSAALGFSAWGISSLRVYTDSANLPADMKSLTVDVADLAVRVESDPHATGPRADLRQVNSSRGTQQRLQVTTDGNGTRMRLSPESSSFMQWRRTAEITVTLPPALAQRLAVTTKQDDGALTVDADLDQLIARTSDGTIVLSASARRIEIGSRDGEVVTGHPISVTESFSATTTDGNVTADFKAVPRTVDVTSRDGDVTIAVPAPGPYLVDARNNADGTTVVRVPQTSDRGAAAAAITARAADGDVAITTLHG